MSRSLWLRVGLLVSLQLSSFCALSDPPLFYIRDLGPGVPRGLNDFGQVVGVFQGDGAVWSETTGFTSLLPYQPSPSTTITCRHQQRGPDDRGFLKLSVPHRQVSFQARMSSGIAPKRHRSLSSANQAWGRRQSIRGSVVGTTGGPSGFFPWIWRNGTLEVLPRLGFPFTGAAIDINDAGVVVGGSARRAVLWRDGLIQDLGVLPGQFFSDASGINNAGAIVGRSGQDAFLWTAESGMVSLGTLAGAPTIALDINDHGWVIGSAGSGGRGNAAPLASRDRHDRPCFAGRFDGNRLRGSRGCFGHQRVGPNRRLRPAQRRSDPWLPSDAGA